MRSPLLHVPGRCSIGTADTDSDGVIVMRPPHLTGICPFIT
jgi:hypothetical protein